VHEDDVGQALLLCIVGAGRPGVYNITGDGVLSGAQVLREFGLMPVRAPASGSNAKRELGWHPRYSGPEALRDTLKPHRQDGS
jgi:nucleoside-diphosphate-sugar epimerase